jgi:hypothetical protein
MQTFCSQTGNKDNELCGCYEDLTGLQKTVYDYLVSKNETPRKDCFLADCNKDNAYKSSSRITANCTEDCNKFLYITNNKFVYTDDKQTKHYVKCVNGVPTEAPYTPSWGNWKCIQVGKVYYAYHVSENNDIELMSKDGTNAMSFSDAKTCASTIAIPPKNLKNLFCTADDLKNQKHICYSVLHPPPPPSGGGSGGGGSGGGGSGGGPNPPKPSNQVKHNRYIIIPIVILVILVAFLIYVNVK